MKPVTLNTRLEKGSWLIYGHDINYKEKVIHFEFTVPVLIRNLHLGESFRILGAQMI